MKGIVESCDDYFYNLGTLLEPNLLAKYARSFGFGLPTGITLNDEKSGLVSTTDCYQSKHGIPSQPGENLSTAIGQG